MSESYKLSGTVKVVGEPQTFGSGFMKRELVVTVEDGKYPQDISVEFCQDKVSLLDSVCGGDTVDVTFNLNGREYNGRYFNSLKGWKVDVAGSGYGSAPSASVDDFNSKEPEDNDGIPF